MEDPDVFVLFEEQSKQSGLEEILEDMAALSVELPNTLNELRLALSLPNLEAVSRQLVEHIFIERVNTGTTVSLHVESRVLHAMNHEVEHLLNQTVIKF